jgi:hypothetical protein
MATGCTASSTDASSAIGAESRRYGNEANAFVCVMRETNKGPWMDSSGGYPFGWLFWMFYIEYNSVVGDSR